ncbi:MAG: chromosome segregation protein SMC, partial [Clostridia bacterium]|nr:chromosome segregation protein SMC [Clostridia bacterium]
AFGVRQIVKAEKEGKLRGILGPVSKLIRVPEDLTLAIETALGNALQNIVTERESDAKAAIRYLKENKLGRVTFLPLDGLEPREFTEKNLDTHKGYLGIAADLVDCDEKLRPVMLSLLGRIVVVETLDDGLKMANACRHRFQIVTREGEILHAGGALTGGSHRKEHSFLSRSEEIRTLEKEIKRLEEENVALVKETEALKDRLTATEAEEERRRNACNALREESARLSAGLEHLATLAEYARQAGDQLKQAEQQLIREKADLQREQVEILALQREQNTRQVKMEEELIGLRQRCEDLHAALETQRQVCLNAELALSEADHARERAEEALRTASYRVMNNASEKQEKEHYIADLKEQIAQKEAERTQLTADGEIHLKQMAEMQADLDRITASAEELEARLLAAQAGSKERRDRLILLQQEHGRLESKLSKAETELEHMTNRLWEEYEITYTDAVAQRIQLESVTAAQRRIGELRSGIRALGPVNVGAIEEYQELSERLTFLTEQQTDLEEAKAQLLKIIDEMTTLMRRQFTERFALINKEFGRVFTELFGGGKASFQLSDENDVLESDIEIIVQPPGKKLQSIALLSGGEKALTAICILFAILKVRPAPFTVMDEIDAALDEANVYRFSDYLKHLSENTQFIVVTHRRGTMESAGTLYGVTMPEKGVSKILPLKLSEIAEE